MERVTVTLAREQVAALKALASKHKVSVAWLVRHAVEGVIVDADNLQLPLLFEPKARHE